MLNAARVHGSLWLPPMPSPGSSGKGKRLVIGNGADPEPAAATEQKPAA